MQAINPLLFTVTAQPHTTKAHAINYPYNVHSNSSTTQQKRMQSNELILFTETAQPHTTKAHAVN